MKKMYQTFWLFILLSSVCTLSFGQDRLPDGISFGKVIQVDKSTGNPAYTFEGGVTIDTRRFKVVNQSTSGNTLTLTLASKTNTTQSRKVINYKLELRCECPNDSFVCAPPGDDPDRDGLQIDCEKTNCCQLTAINVPQ